MVDRHNWQHIVRLGFWSVQLYADVTLQLFFIATSITGWIHWLKGQGGDILPVRRTASQSLFPFVALCCRRGRRLRLFTPHLYQCLAPWLDSLILTFSVLAQFMLMGRRIENWFVWLAVNTAVPLYMTRGLNLTAGLYFLFWINAWHGLYQWRKELQTS